MQRSILTSTTFVAAVAIGTSAFVPGSAFAVMIYAKEFYVAGVAANAGIDAGLVVQTWGSPVLKDGLVQGTHLVAEAPAGKPDQKVEVTYTHAMDLILRKAKDGKIDKGVEQGLPIGPTGKIVDAKAGPPVVPGGYDSGTISITDAHTAPNTAEARIKVDQRVVGALPLTVRKAGGGTELVTLKDTVHTVIIGKADAGKPDPKTDVTKDVIHSADSFAAAEIKGGATFVGGAGRPAFTEITGRTVMSGGSFNFKGTGGLNLGFDDLDPYFVDLVDLDLDTATREKVMTREVSGRGALYSIDDSGIRLTINKDDPNSSVSLMFSSGISSWVLNPYTYGAKLDASGFSALGVTPQSDWIITSSPDMVEAFFPFFGEQPYDYAMINPPDSLFVDTHTYRYDAGASEGVFEIMAVPAPSTLLLLGGVLLGWVGWGRGSGMRVRLAG